MKYNKNEKKRKRARKATCSLLGPGTGRWPRHLAQAESAGCLVLPSISVEGGTPGIRRHEEQKIAQGRAWTQKSGRREDSLKRQQREQEERRR